MRLFIHSEADAEIDEAIAFYEERQAGLGLDFLAEVERAIDTLLQLPELGVPYKRTEFRYWVLRKFPFVIYYATLPDAIWIAAIAHERRRPGYWKKRSLETDE